MYAIQISTVTSRGMPVREKEYVWLVPEGVLIAVDLKPPPIAASGTATISEQRVSRIRGDGSAADSCVRLDLLLELQGASG
jgi:hypothetical protein